MTQNDTRRDFLRKAGVAGAGVTAAAWVTPAVMTIDAAGAATQQAIWTAVGRLSSGFPSTALARTAPNPATTWTASSGIPTTPATPGLRDIVRLPGDQWLAVGNGSLILVNSTDPTTGAWTVLGTAVPSASGSNFVAVATDGTNAVAAGGSGGRRVIVQSSTPMTSWPNAPVVDSSTAPNNTPVRGLATAGGTWVGVGDGGLILASTTANGTGPYSAATSGTTNQLQGVATDGTDWVAVGASNTVRHTTTPTGSWAAASSVGGTSVTLNDVFTVGGVWVAVGTGGRILTSTAPSGTWTQQTSGSTNNLQGVFGQDAGGTTTWVVVGLGTILVATATTGTAPTTWPAATTPNIIATDLLEDVVI